MGSEAVLHVESFQSILSERLGGSSTGAAGRVPELFADLNLDLVIGAITANWNDCDLKPFYYAPLHDLSTITYRQEVFRDLEETHLMRAIQSFSERMRVMRAHLKQADDAKRLDYDYARRRLFFGAAGIYCEAIEHLSADLCAANPASRGLQVLRDYLIGYIASGPFQGLVVDTRELKAALSAIRYCLLLQEGSVTVRRYEAEADYSIAVEQVFAKFRRDAASRYRREIRDEEGTNHIEAQIQDRVALLYPDTFQALDAFCAAHLEYVDGTIARFDREIQFYTAYLTYIEKFRRAGLRFCQPQLSQRSKAISAQNAFDIALANRLVAENTTVVLNDFCLKDPERILVVSGPNQGGKTTFARMIGQLHYLASLGCPVPGSGARLFVPDRIFTHFERQERITNLRGKLQDDLLRIHRILDEATPGSLIIMNEMFSSTTLRDAVYLSRKVMTKLAVLDLLGVWVTFLDELSSLNEKTVSIVSTVDPGNPASRTFKLERRPADGLAYALAIAQKYRVTYGQVKERIRQ